MSFLQKKEFGKQKYVNSSQLLEDFPTRGHQLSLDQDWGGIFENAWYQKSFIIKSYTGNQTKGKSKVYLCPNKTTIQHNPGVNDWGATHMSALLSIHGLPYWRSSKNDTQNYEPPFLSETTQPAPFPLQN